MSDQFQGQIPTVAFGTTPEMQSHLAELVATGVKRATTSVRAAYQAQGEPLPAADELATAGDGAGQAVCTIRTTHVEIRRYADIDQAHASAEGEGARTLSLWKRDHRPFLNDVYDSLGIPFDADPELVLERFDVVDPPAPGARHHEPKTVCPARRRSHLDIWRRRRPFDGDHRSATRRPPW